MKSKIALNPEQQAAVEYFDSPLLIVAGAGESGALEQDADVVAFIHRADAFRKADEVQDGKAEVIVAKQRNGPTGSAHLAFLKTFSRFENLSLEESVG